MRTLNVAEAVVIDSFNGGSNSRSVESSAETSVAKARKSVTKSFLCDQRTSGTYIYIYIYMFSPFRCFLSLWVRAF
jgi:hypothetical protein